VKISEELPNPYFSKLVTPRSGSEYEASASLEGMITKLKGKKSKDITPVEILNMDKTLRMIAKLDKYKDITTELLAISQQLTTLLDYWKKVEVKNSQNQISKFVIR